MGFCFSKPDKKQLLEESRERIADNARTLSVCVELAEGELREKTERVYDAVRFMIPAKEVGAAQADKKISSLSGDLKIALSKRKESALVQAAEIIADLNSVIAERNSYTN